MRTHKPESGLSPGLIVNLVMLVLLGLLFATTNLLAGGVPNEVCADCHDEVSEIFHQTSHARYFSARPDWVEFGCESCHGNGFAHVEEGDPGKIINPANTDGFSQQLCLDCHKDNGLDEWAFSHHNNADVNCSSCHAVHEPAGQVTKKQGENLCYDCHSDVRAAASMPSHHPIGEGMLSCTDCHTPHGGQLARTADGTGKELCFSCHADVEGPFVFEHAPVAEDCMLCHTPHGSVADKLLKQSEPSLCLNCHAMHFHATIESVPGDFTTPQAPGRAGTSDLDSFKRGMLTKCTQCHTAVHGSDLPSQATSTGGTGLTR